MLISEARLAGSSRGLIWGIVGASVITLVASSLVSGTPVPGLLLAAGILPLTWTIVRMTVSIAMADKKIVLRCGPFYSSEISISDVLAIATAPETSLADGYGFRMLGNGTRGLLVGGPAVALETNNRRWIISTTHPEEVTSAIRGQMKTR
ncbi:hypothetical protein AB0323_08955 [Arthrobacter sp. NPDC080031]|uniref:hypothetical protein n=1 Tax=Arthrobacter sp. NPDC080031 TaxID=3155918 RepID=UPI00344DE123